MHPIRSNRGKAAMLAAACGALVLLGSSAARADLTGFTDFTLNNGATSDGTTLTLTDGGGSENRSAFSNTQQSVNTFTANFTYTDVGGGGADGFTFALQNDPRGAGAVGDPGGALGYGGPVGTAIQPSAAVAFNIYGPGGGSQSGYNVNGGTSRYPTGPVDITSGNPINVSLAYNGQYLRETLTDTVAGTTNTKIYAANVPASAGGATAYVGFTGGTGGATSTQTISNFTYTTGAAPVIRAMTPIAATGYNRDVIVEAGAIADPTTGFAGAVSATVDAGDAKTNFTFYQAGLSGGAKGLPVGTTATSAADANTTFTIQSAAGNNAVQVTADNPTGTLTLAAPKAYSLLSVFATTGSGSNPTAPMTIHFANGRPDLATTYYAPDWFGNGQFAVTDLDRVNVGTGAFDNNVDNPRIYQTTLDLAALGAGNDPIASIDFGYGGAGTTEIFGISGAATAVVPEPATMGLFGLAAFGLLLRRRQAR